MSVKVLHTADNHLDPVLTKFRHKINDRRKDFWRSFKKVLEYANEKRPDLFLISGDLFDKVNPRNPPRTLLMRYFRALYNKGVKIFVIGGHHDVPKSIEEGASPLDELAASGYVTFFSNRKKVEASDIQIRDLNVCVSGITYDFTLSAGSDPLQFTRPVTEGDVNIFMVHYVIENFNVSKSYMQDPVVRIRNIPREITYVAAGHLHSHQEMRVYNTLIAYPGSTERKSFLEEKDERKGFLWVELNEDGVRNKEFIETPARKMKTIKFNIENSRDPVQYVIKEAEKYADTQLILRIRVEGNVGLDTLIRYKRDEIIRSLINKFFFVMVDDKKLGFKKSLDIGSIEMQTPIDAFLSYINNLINLTKNERERKILERAREIGESYLREVGGW